MYHYVLSRVLDRLREVKRLARTPLSGNAAKNLSGIRNVPETLAQTAYERQSVRAQLEKLDPSFKMESF